jgi:hypothetical protein
LKHRAYFGVSAALSLGQDNGTDVFVVRKEVIPVLLYIVSPAAASRRLSRVRNEIPTGSQTEDEARAAVREQAALGVDIIKIWVDDRLGKYKKLSPEIYGAAIDEAHKAGLRAIAHEYYLADAKELLRRGIDAFAHGVRDTDVDDEFVALVKAHPGFVLIPNLPERRRRTDLSWLAKSLPPAELEPLRAAAVDNAEAQAFFAIQARNLARVSREGIAIALGTDGNTRVGSAPRDGGYGRFWDVAGRRARRRDEECRGVLEARRRGHGRAGKIGSFIVLEAESARRHYEHPQDSRCVFARRPSSTARPTEH